MKKQFLILLLVLVLLFPVGCNKENGNTNVGGNEDVIKEKVSLAVPQGNPFIAVGNLLGTENLSIDVFNGGEGAKVALTGNKYDLVVAPLNLGTLLYNNSKSQYKLEAIVSLGNTYIISKSDKTLMNITDLEGKTILAHSQGGTPDIILKYVLQANNVNCTIEYVVGVSDVVPLFMQGQYDYALAAEPVITNLLVKKGVSLNVINLQNYMEETIFQAALFVNPNSTNKESIDIVIKKIKENIESMNKNTDKYVDEIVNKDVYFSDLGAQILKISIPNSSLEFVDAESNKTTIEQYLTLILPLIGKKLPDEAFYN